MVLDFNDAGSIVTTSYAAPYEKVFDRDNNTVALRADPCQNASTVATVAGIAGGIGAIGASGAAGAIFAGALCPPCAVVGLGMCVRCSWNRS